jgi:hypothetical protein
VRAESEIGESGTGRSTWSTDLASILASQASREVQIGAH